MQNKLLFILIASLGVCRLSAQDIVFKASAPKYVRVGEQFQVQFSTNKNVDDFTPPSFDGFDFLGGPMQSTSSNSSFENGKWIHSSTVSFIYYLRAKQPGKFSLAPATAVYKKNSIQSNSIEIEVVGASSQGGTQQSSATTNASQSPSVTEKASDDLFVSLIVDKKSAYVGEQITAWVKIYTKIQLTGIDMQTYKGPEFAGFFKENIEIPPLTGLEREKLGNEIYLSGVLQKFIIYPQKSGKIVVDPFDLVVEIQKQTRQSRSIFDEFFGQAYASAQVKLTSKPVEINVKQLPEPKPDAYTGAVGLFNISGSLNTNKVRENDAVSFRISLTGKGNLKLIENIHSELPSSLEVYDPVIKSNIDKSGYGGSKTFEITAIPRHAGTFDIKPFSLVYFDPSSGSYKTIQTQSFSLDVAKGEGDSSAVIISNLSKEDVELLGSDIRFIKTQTNFTKSGTYLNNSFLYFLAYIVCIGIVLTLLIIKREQIKRGANIAHTRHKKATKLANKRFKNARVLLKQGNNDGFYEELSKALWGYLSDKLSIPVSSLSSIKAKEELINKGVEESLADEYISVISNCEFTRYAPGAAGQKPEDTYLEAVKVLTGIDQKL